MFIMVSTVWLPAQGQSSGRADTANTQTSTGLADTLRMQFKGDSTGAKRDAIEVDTLVRFMPGIGALKWTVDSSSAFHRTNFIWTDAAYPGDLMWRIPGFFLSDLGEAGKPDQLSDFGALNKVSFLLDGRPMFDPITGSFNLSDIPLEFVEEMEVINRAGGFLYGQTGTTTALNFTTRQYSTMRPVTKIRYIQSPLETILTDGLFTQNIARGVNFMFSFQRHVSDGHFRNAALDAWNLRTRLRYNISDRINVSLMDFYTKSINGMNGGVDLGSTSSEFDPIAATVKTRNGSETLSRRDVTLSILGRFMSDSASTTQLNLYYSTADREFSDVDALTGSLTDDSYSSSYLGFRSVQRLRTDWFQTQFGFDYQQRRVDKSSKVIALEEPSSALFATVTPAIADFLRIDAHARYEYFRNKNLFSSGVDASLGLGLGFRLFGSLSNTVSPPTIQELYWSDSLVMRAGEIKNETSQYSEAGIRFDADSAASLSVSGIQRTTHDGIAFHAFSSGGLYPGIRIENVPEINARGARGSARVRVWNFEAFGTATYLDYAEGDTNKLLFPKLVLSGELSYRDKFFNNALDAKIGIRSRYMSRHQGMTYVPQEEMYVENTGTTIGYFTTFDVYVILKIGDAYVTLAWGNLPNSNYLITPVYPMPGREFKLAINWVFID